MAKRYFSVTIVSSPSVRSNRAVTLVAHFCLTLRGFQLSSVSVVCWLFGSGGNAECRGYFGSRLWHLYHRRGNRVASPVVTRTMRPVPSLMIEGQDVPIFGELVLE